MSTLRTDTLQNLAETFSVDVVNLASSVNLANAVDPTKGAALVGYKGRTVKAKLDNAANVLDDNGSGSADPTGATDSTAAFVAAAGLGNGTVYVPAGTYKIAITSLPAGTTMVGDGEKTILKPLTPDTRAAIAINSASAITFIDNLTFRDLTFQGSVDVDGFSEQKHLLTLNGVRNTLVENCRFIGFRGDGIYIGSGDVGGLEKHNHNVRVVGCFFDGVNKDNRNGISVVDCSSLTIDSNYLTRCSRSNMPGAIDIEPNANNYHVIQDINITNNRIVDTGGNVAAIGIQMPGITYTSPPRGFLIKSNYIDTCTATGIHFNYTAAGGISDSTANFALRVSENIVAIANRPFTLFNTKDAVIRGNSFQSCPQPALVSFNTVNENVIGLAILNNMFERCGSVGGNGISIFKCSRLQIDGNTFDDCGTGVAGSANAVQFNTGVSSNVSISNNNFVSPTGKTLVAIQKEAAHTFTPGTNNFSGNDLNGLTNNFQFSANEACIPTYTKEGESFLPTITGSVSPGAGTYTTRLGFYTKVGKLINFQYEITWTAHTGTGQLYVSLPEAVNALSPGLAPVSVACSGLTLAAGAQPVFLLNKTPANRLQLYTLNAGVLASFSVPASGTLYISGSYLSA